MKYKIYDLSVRAMLNYSKSDGDSYNTVIDQTALRSCLKHSAHEQDDNALFYQIMCVLHSDDFSYRNTDLVTELSDIIFYADFSRVFDRDSAIPYYAQLQKKAESLFMSQGASIDFGSGMHRYSDYVVLPVANFDAYFGSTNFSRKWLNLFPDTLLEREKQSFGVCRAKVTLPVIY